MAGVLVAATPCVVQAAPPSKRPARSRSTAHVAPVAPRTSARDALGGRAESVGTPTDGRLVGGTRLEAGPTVRVVPVYAGDDSTWGTDELVGLLRRASTSVAKKHPGSILSIGHLSRRNGGNIDRHHSHESGRDADVGFFVVDHRKKAAFADHFVPFVADGTAPTWPGARFDDARNWAFVAAIVSDPRVEVSHVFVASPLRARLLAYAQRAGVPLALRVRAAERMVQPHGALPHDDHFHVRIVCPARMRACVERPAPPKVARGARGARGAPPAAARGGALAASPGGASPNAGASPASPPPPPPRTPTPDEPSARTTRREEGGGPGLLGPEIPGLDAVVIPKRLAPVDDVDGDD